MAAHTNLSSLFPNDRTRLHAFRRVAKDTHRLLRKEYDRKLSVGSETSLIPEAILRSASQPIRIVTLEKESAHLPDVLAALRRLQDPSVDADADRVERAFQRVKAGQMHMQWIEKATNKAFTYSGWSLVEFWFYGESFHHETDKQEDVQRLRDLAEVGAMELQLTILKLGAIIFALDTLIADVLGEQTLAEIRESRGDYDQFF